MTPEHTLERLKAASVQHLALKTLETDEALQPREARMVPFRDQGRQASRSETHTGTLRLALESSHHIQLEPVLIAKIDGTQYVVDGHHRLRAYQRARRETIPARMLPLTRKEAALVSKLVNCSERALEMHDEQKRDAAWQYLTEVTRRGTAGLPEGESLRTIQGRFGVSKDTVRRMLQKLPKVNPRDYATQAHDPGTGWPRWRYVRGAGQGWQDLKDKMTPEQLTQHEGEKLARKIGTLLDNSPPEAVRLALGMLADEAQEDANNADTRSFLLEIAEPSDF